MGKIDDAVSNLQTIEDKTDRAFELAGLISTLFKLRGMALIVTGRLAFESYANQVSESPELELAILAGKMTPRLLQEIMAGQLQAEGSIDRWVASGIPVRFVGDFNTTNRDLCRDFTTNHGMVKLMPAEDIAAERILAAVYPVPNETAREEALILLVNALTDAFQMDWTALHTTCHLPDFRVGEELAQYRTAAKQEADALGAPAQSAEELSLPESESPTEVSVPQESVSEESVDGDALPEEAPPEALSTPG